MKITRLLIGLVNVVVLGISILVVLSFVPGDWYFDLLTQFRLVYVIGLLACLVVLTALRAYKSLAVAALVLIAAVTPVATMFIPLSSGLNDENAMQTISIMNFNTEFQHNDDYHKFADLLEINKPDVLALVETDQKWVNGLSESLARYAYQQVVIKGPGIALFSKYPVSNVAVFYYGKSHHPRISAELRIKKRTVQVVVAHPTTPKTRAGFMERNAELRLIGDEMRSKVGTKILIGDLNCGPWSGEFRQLLGDDLIDSEQGFGPQPSWPARTGRVIEHLLIPPFVPIDHILISKDICVVQRIVGPAIGSDHLPVFVKLKL